MKFKCPGTVAGPCPSKVLIERLPGKGQGHRIRCDECQQGQRRLKQRVQYRDTPLPKKFIPPINDKEAIMEARLAPGIGGGVKAASKFLDAMKNQAT